MMIRKFFSEILIYNFLLFVALSSCSDGIPQLPEPSLQAGDTARVMTLVYMMAENSLADYASSDLNEMFSAAESVPDDCYMLAFVDDRKLPRICRFYNSDGVAVCDTVYKFKTDFCSSDIAEMAKVFDVVLENYPAERINIVLWSHGTGWISDMNNSPSQRIIGIDNGHNSYSNQSVESIDISELAAFLGNLPQKPRLLLFDACFMQSVEVAYELRNAVDWIIASPAEIPADGAPYDKITSAFFDVAWDSECDSVVVSAVDALLRGYYDNYAGEYYGVVLSAIRCSEMDNLADRSAGLIEQYFSAPEDDVYGSIFSYLPGGYFPSGKAYYPDFYDINDAMLRVLPAGEYEAWRVALDAAVPLKYATDSWYSAPHACLYAVEKERYCGVSAYLPTDNSLFNKYNSDFRSTEWYKAAGWEQAGW